MPSLWISETPGCLIGCGRIDARTAFDYGYPNQKLDIHRNFAVEHFKVAKWGNSLAVRLPRKLVKEMGLKEGDLIPQEVVTRGGLIRARLAAQREANKMTRDEAEAAIREARKDFPKDLRPEDWKIDRNDPDMRG